MIFQWENILKLAPEGWLSCVEKSARKSQKFAPKKGFVKVVNLTTCVKISAKKISSSGQTGSIEHSRTITSLSGQKLAQNRWLKGVGKFLVTVNRR